MNLKLKEMRLEAKDIFSIIFEKPDGFQFYPAQFIDVTVDIPNPDNSRIYSLSSSPTEQYLMITFKRGISDHKRKLQTLKAGDIVTITLPSGTYTLDETSPAVMLAGGVGIAPHRSMIKYAVDSKLKTPLTLIYSNSDKDFPFKKELDRWQKEYSTLSIHYIVTSKYGRLDITKLTTIVGSLANKIFYLAGPPSFVYDMEKILKELGADSVDIRLDSFDGY